ncbi:hypothetical protein HYH03_002739 [Edaphochlamys debaryana]|uniref:Uncharacterized protein n=1 Tax=Edaphochlamys debaryana TaxID=47281 RepID=A0A835YAL3_9CHLO|nr:hypothetical protein HYH03_002739 [Edaphochlamys debaryana]|eukprot:KAG2499158.1 hypothetical protein HYH03_002739 [Edaphochlamys debaryana]
MGASSDVPGTGAGEEDAMASAPSPSRAADSAAPSTIAALNDEVSAASARVAALRQRVTQGVVTAVAAQAEALRPALRGGEMTLSTPSKADRRRSMELDEMPPSAALRLHEQLMQATDKLPALRARMDEVTRRMTNVLRAIEEQRAFSKAAPTPLRSITPLKRAAEEGQGGVVGIIARAACQ